MIRIVDESEVPDFQIEAYGRYKNKICELLYYNTSSSSSIIPKSVYILPEQFEDLKVLLENEDEVYMMLNINTEPFGDLYKYIIMNNVKTYAVYDFIKKDTVYN